MNIEQIAKESRLSMLRDFNGLSKEINICVKDDTEFLRRCLKKLAEQDVGRANWKPLPEDQNERITFDRALHNIYEGDARLAVAITLRTFANAMSGGTFADTCRVMANEVAKLYTEAQLLAAQQRTAEACAKVCSKEAWAADAMDAIRDGHWRKYQ